ncbi:MAG: hypothetical protein V3W08_01550 [Candidatus Binatia bacterium]
MPKKKTIKGGKAGTRCAAVGRKIRTLLPQSVQSHLKASIREALLAVESIFDEAVKALEKEGKKEKSTKGKKIKVE